MKKYFVTGLIILLPFAVTAALVFFVIDFITLPFVSHIEHFLENKSWYLQHKWPINFLIQLLLLFLIFLFTVLLGVLARIVAFKSILSLYDYILHRIPVIKSIYKAAQQVIKTIFGSTSQSFKQVVMVQFPIEGSYCIGLVSGKSPSLCDKTVGQSLMTVFIPTTPNPTSGFLVMYKEEAITYLDMKVEDAFKYIISCGVITNEG